MILMFIQELTVKLPFEGVQCEQSISSLTDKVLPFHVTVMDLLKWASMYMLRVSCALKDLVERTDSDKEFSQRITAVLHIKCIMDLLLSQLRRITSISKHEDGGIMR